MRKTPAGLVHSATDIVNFLECGHITTLDLRNLEAPLEKADEDDQARLLQERGLAHEHAYLDQLEAVSRRVIRLAGSQGALDEAIAQTVAAMRSGPDVIYQGALSDALLAGYPDFLVRVDRPSLLGNFSYEVEDTKLARSSKAKFLIQLCFYSALLGRAQGVVPERMHVVLGDGTRVSYRVADYLRYYEHAKSRYLARIADKTVLTRPERCAKCAECRWSHLCDAQWVRDDHLNQVAGIRQTQIRRLNDEGIRTLADLAQLPAGRRVARMAPETLENLRHQAELQFRARQGGGRIVELLPQGASERPRGLSRLPEPDQGDLYFDMEGDPLEAGGLEYLFGVATMVDGALQFQPFWAHSRTEEKKAFESFIDFVSKHLRQHPHAHIYHYAAYEETALKRLMSLHGTREKEVDHLLRRQKLVDLYKVVREGLRVSEPRYSIKNIEHFYMDARAGDVQNAGASIVYYERWRQTRDDALLRDIENYNRDDVFSTAMLHRWLLQQRPAGMAWRASGTAADDTATDTPTDDETVLAKYRDALLKGVPEDAADLDPDQAMRVLTLQLLDFHRREQKPQWWALFNRMELSEAELIDDIECLGGLERDPQQPPEPVKRSLVYTYRYPEQETKLKDGDACTRTDTGSSLGEVMLDAQARIARIKLGGNREAPPDKLQLGPGLPVNNHKLRNRIRDFADSVVAGDARFAAVKGMLRKSPPVIAGCQPGGAVVADPSRVDEVVRAVANLQQSHLFIQGPPGAGKTWTGSRVIVELLRAGKSVGVSSNSHKAIHNLLHGVVNVARQAGVGFRGFKKCSKGAETRFECPDVFDNGTGVSAFDAASHALFAGTAWAFADLPEEQVFDYLFVDEAGQVSLANLVVMGIHARNVVLLGDQMQLGQPIQGVHPGRSGESALEYLLDGRATIAPDEGIFLPLSWRMHPSVCGFISAAVYDGKLKPAPGLDKQALVLDDGAHPVLAPAGVRYLPMAHADCAQKSEEEAGATKEIFASLLHQHCVDKDGKIRPVTIDDILVVSPYNMQVNLLRDVLPEGARVGTVDKFQGQEAQVVLVSMATSSGDDLPRDIEFLYSRNRLNVAISRAKCLAVVIANPRLMEVRCSTPEQMALINTLCWVKDWSQPTASCARAADEDAVM